MLILSRSTGQRVCVGDDVTVTVISIDARGHVRLGFEGPGGIEIDREEVRTDKRIHGRHRLGVQPLHA